MKKNLLTELNPEQKKAVLHTSGPLLIIAGAGTGKTTVIVEKIKHVIAQKTAKPEQILALTFTEKAAVEMEERVDKAMPYGYFQMWISTFHSFADQILRNDISHIGLNSGYRLMTQAEAILFLRKNLFHFDLKYFRPFGNPNKFLSALLQHFSRLKDEDISPESYKTWAEKQFDNTSITSEEKEKSLELARAYKKFQELKIEQGYFDFSDLIYYALQLFRERPSILKKYQEMYRFVLVDEFQDTNIAQYLLMKLLCPSSVSPNLTVVGDDSQAIYKFRGASISNILTFMRDYPDAQQITLKHNYRSYQEILDYSHKLIQHNNPDTLEHQLSISKKLTAQRGMKQECTKLFIAEKIGDEAEYVANEIISLQKKNNYKFSDFALLVRANNHADPFINAFIRKGIPYRFFGPGMLLKQPEIKDLIAYLKTLYNLEDSVALYRVLSMDIFGLDQKDISLLLSYSKKLSLSLFNTIEIYLSFFYDELKRDEYALYKKYLPLLAASGKDKFFSVYSMLCRHLKLIKSATAGQILYYFLEDTGYLNKLITFTSEKEERIAININKFFTKLKNYELSHEDSSVFAIVDYLEMSMELGESPLIDETDLEGYNAVNILTVHAAKGLEFGVVFLPNLSRGRFPTYEKKEPLPIPQELIKELLPQGDYHLQEERRLFYVAVTRAKDRVYFTLSQMYGEGKRERKISPFVIETLGEDSIAKFQSFKKEEKSQMTIFDFKIPDVPLTRQKLSISSVSYSQIESFNLCPLQYKYQYILKVPTVPSAAASFGDSIHKTLQRFYQEFMNNKNITVDRLMEIYKELWIPIHFSSLEHQNHMKKEGEQMLRKYFETFHRRDTSVFAIEKLFKIRISHNVYITGKIDRVDAKFDKEIEIIDYKTGKKPDEKEIKKSLQLSIYALAATDPGLFHKKPDQVTLTFYYLQDMQKISMKRAQSEIESVKDTVEKTVDLMNNNRFEAKVGPWCDFCSFRLLCEAWQ